MKEPGCYPRFSLLFYSLVTVGASPLVVPAVSVLTSELVCHLIEAARRQFVFLVRVVVAEPVMETTALCRFPVAAFQHVVVLVLRTFVRTRTVVWHGHFSYPRWGYAFSKTGRNDCNQDVMSDSVPRGICRVDASRVRNPIL